MIALNRVLAAAAAAVLIASGVLLVIEAAAAALRVGPLLAPLSEWDAALEVLRWDDPGVLPVLLCVAAAGLVLVAVEAVPRRSRSRRLAGDGRVVTVTVRRRGVERRLGEAIESSALVRSCRVRLGRRRVRLTIAVAGPRAVVPARQAALATIGGEIERLGLRRRPRVRVEVTAGRARVA